MIRQIISTHPDLQVVTDATGLTVIRGKGGAGMQGPKGDKGDTGATGPRGAQGANGAKGLSDGGLPIGAIILWNKPLSQIPAGWKFCDGSNGTPDLRNKILVGVDTGVDPGGLFELT